ncbi:tol-pal system protein YbgF [Caldithrix abyssi]|uniref:Tol-pal system protein YbgF n=1 Tax=Caldithrix abyssi DSM 13497 TaxID=880073 RepID=H1XY55_CALAY|nr:tol-pal system protein YbgF [Caldithrix abyssi]APF17925.1 tol-pal system protein YbgF [Caldithrix abyssi DSM 13497]EHO41982.1 tol-pal system protein YbgF [Caldithrix abyssi DSM 13497]
MYLRYFSLLFLIFSFLLFSCAGSRKNQDAEYQIDDSQQQDLTDIEKLLGIETTTETPKKKQKPKEQLNLLDESDIANPDQSMAAAATRADSKEIENYKKRIQSLQRQLKDKDRLIQQLKDQLAQQSLKIEQLQQKKGKGQLYVPSVSSSAAAAGSGDYEATYQQARQAFEARDYQSALSLFQTLLSQNANHPLADNAQYWIGECHYALRQYDAAILDFQKVFTFPNSNKAPDAQFKLVLCYLKKGDMEKAREEYERLRTDYPDSPYVDRATEILSRY